MFPPWLMKRTVWTKWESWPVVCYTVSPSGPGNTRPQLGFVLVLTNCAVTAASFLCDKTNILGMPCKIHFLSSQSLHSTSLSLPPFSDPVLFCPLQRVWLILIQLADWSHISLDKLSGPQQQQFKVLLLFFFYRSLVVSLSYSFLSYFLSLLFSLLFCFLARRFILSQGIVKWCFSSSRSSIKLRLPQILS